MLLESLQNAMAVAIGRPPVTGPTLVFRRQGQEAKGSIASTSLLAFPAHASRAPKSSLSLLVACFGTGFHLTTKRCIYIR